MIDRIDAKILQELSRDSRQSVDRIALVEVVYDRGDITAPATCDLWAG